MSGAASLEVEVSEVTTVAQRVKRFRLAPLSSSTLPAFSPGAHILITLDDGARKFRNAYSLMGSPFDNRCYQISVLNTENSRGGSRYIHELVRPGSRLHISHPVNLFPLARLGRKHVFIAGGIGITPFLPMMEELNAHAVPFELHYSFRSMDRAPYVREISRAYDARVSLYETENAQRLRLGHVFTRQPLGTHLYVCGPERMIEEVMSSASEHGWPAAHLHSERFLGGSAGKPFTVALAKSKRTIRVSEHESLLEALEAAGVEAPFLCRGGSCGQCETRVLACDGELIHNDHYLRPDERTSRSKIMICVSRAEGGNLVLDL
jgi:dimethylamine monooxygenase subunit B